MMEVKKFISSISQLNSSSNTLEMTRVALRLLKTIPATRDAVLEYFCSIFSIAVTKHLRQLENRIQHQRLLHISEENIVVEIHVVLNNFLVQNPESWAPIILDWSLDLLGKLSSDYMKHITFLSNAGINDCLQYWMSCQATRVLISITTQCFQCLIYSNAESCIKSLIHVSNLHNPNFDWFMAHVGSCFPNFLISKVLSCGLKDFCAIKSTECKDRKIEVKLNSVVSILSHLACSHFYDIKTSLFNLFMWSINKTDDVNEDTTTQKLATVPFLLNLALLSPMMLKAISNQISQILKQDVILKLAPLSSEWTKYFNNDIVYLMNRVVALSLSCNENAFQLISILLDVNVDSNHKECYNISVYKNIKIISHEILELILEETEFTVRMDHMKVQSVPLVTSVKQELSTILSYLLFGQPLRVKTALRLLCLLGSHNSQVLVSTASYILLKAKTNFQIALFIRFYINSISSFSKKNKYNCVAENEYFSQILQQALREGQHFHAIDKITMQQLFKNLSTLLKWENWNKVPCLKSNTICKAISANLLQISTYLMKTIDFNTANNIACMLIYLDLFRNCNLTSIEVTLRLTKAIVHYFFLCIAETDTITKENGVKIVCHLLKGLTACSQNAKVLALREILEITIFSDLALHFGAKQNFKLESPASLLLQQNHKQGTGAILAQRHSSVFHAGIIGQGPRTHIFSNAVNKELVQLNNTLLIEVLKVCCSTYHFNQNIIDTDSLTLVSLLLVELLSPDVMYNGLPWPEEEFTKVTVERDLQIRRSFEDKPFLWTLLQLTAWHRPALAYCSVLLRAIVSTLLSNWNNDLGTNILNILILGQLLPPPLTTITDIFPVLKAYQVSTIVRECVWMYVHENIPSPMLFTRFEGTNIVWRDTEMAVPARRFTEILRIVFLSNIRFLGSKFATIFFIETKNT